MGLEHIKDEQIKKLAIMLRQNGMAASDTEAERMAEEMSSTSKKVQQAYDDQETTDEPSDEKLNPVEQTSSQLDSSASKDESIPFGNDDVINDQKAFIDSSYKEILDSNKTVSELMEENFGQSEVSSDLGTGLQSTDDLDSSSSEDVINSDDSIDSDDALDKSVVSDVSNLSDDIVISDPDEQNFRPDMVEESESEEPEIVEDSDVNSKKESSPDETVDEPSQEGQEKESSDVKDAPESKVNLSEVFNFGKR